MRSHTARTIRALPTLLRIGVAETVAYRAEFIVWMLTSTMPLINLAFWSAVTRDGAFQGYDGSRLTAYFLGCLIVRNLTGNWVAFQIGEEVRIEGSQARFKPHLANARSVTLVATGQQLGAASSEK